MCYKSKEALLALKAGLEKYSRDEFYNIVEGRVDIPPPIPEILALKFCNYFTKMISNSDGATKDEYRALYNEVDCMIMHKFADNSLLENLGQYSEFVSACMDA